MFVIYQLNTVHDLSLDHALIFIAGASTAEAQTRVAKEIAEQFLALRDGKSTFGCLNAPLLR